MAPWSRGRTADREPSASSAPSAHRLTNYRGGPRTAPAPLYSDDMAVLQRIYNLHDTFIMWLGRSIYSSNGRLSFRA